jgi:ribosome-associated toxin RatA of RatAB toxin-antitoxin module
MQQRQRVAVAAAATAAPAARRRHPCNGSHRPLLLPLVRAAATNAADVAPLPTADLAAAAAPSCRLVKDVAVGVQRTSITSRVLVAAVDIAAPPSAVWASLTDYEKLAEFIPSLEANECLSHDPEQGTARLRQVGAQDVAMGVKFRAAVTLDIREHCSPGGIPAELITTSQDSRDYLGAKAKFPAPVAQPGEDDEEEEAMAEAAARGAGEGEGEAGAGQQPGDGAASSSASCASSSWPRDISFELVEGDFSAFRGVWRISEGPAGPLTARLSYAVFVQPQAFLPVGLIQGRISRDVATNLKSVRAHAEEVVFERLMRQQQQQQAQSQQQQQQQAMVAA